ncbi:MAG: SDR family oxidoreductase [Saprospiraceae bacterium]
MKILLTGATGYIGKRLLPVLIDQGHEVYACTRDKSRFEFLESWKGNVRVVEVDFLEKPNLKIFPKEFDVAYYLVHSMSASIGDFEEKESQSAMHFKTYMDASSVKQIIYLTGIVNENKNLSPHLQSRLNVESILNSCQAPLTALRAGIIVGSGSASFEIIRDIVEKLPIMITPKWLNTKCQPIGIRNVMEYLIGVLLKEKCFNQNYDISSGEVLTYREMLLGYAKVRKLKRYIFTAPVMTPRLSSYWLYFVTSTSYPLAVNLVNSMKVNVIARNNDLQKMLNIKNISYYKSVEMAFQRIEQNMVVSSWKDSFVSSLDQRTLEENMEVPQFGCFKDKKQRIISADKKEQVLENIWSIGGERGWYYGNFLWRIRGFMDKLIGGVGLRRGRTHQGEIHAGDALDFWRVMIADTEKKRLLLYAEMILPGDAWLEFKIVNEQGQDVLKQTATFRPDGIWGRLYWYSVLPFHYFVFNGMIENIIKFKK